MKKQTEVSEKTRTDKEDLRLKYLVVCLIKHASTTIGSLIIYLVREHVSPELSCRHCGPIRSPFDSGFTTDRGYHGRYLSPPLPRGRGEKLS